MAKFTRADLREILGDAHSEEIENRLMALHLAVVDPLKDALQAAQTEASAAKNSGEYATLKKQFEDYKAEVETKETKAAKKAALTKLAKDAGLTDVGIAKAVKYADYDALELDEKGEIKDGNAAIKALREEWPEHVQKTTTTGASTATPPVNNTGKAYKTKEEIFAIIDPAERQKAIAENHEMFGF